jgi:23S rRNA pseudouridine955/2504/2580 synthase
MTAGRNPPVAARRVRVGDGFAGQRLDNFLLRELSGVPRSRVYRLLRRGEVRVNGKRKQADYRLAAADEVRLPPLRGMPALDEGPRRVPDALLEAVRQAIIHEDGRLLVLNKPAGLAHQCGSGDALGAVEALRALRPEEPLELAHRLDRDTSGCLLVARTRAALRIVHALLREGAVEKHYATLLAGRWRLGCKTIDRRQGRDCLREANPLATPFSRMAGFSDPVRRRRSVLILASGPLASRAWRLASDFKLRQ